jgi:hypothetical protein
MSSEGRAGCGPVCLTTHSIVNKLSVIIGNCQLLGERATDPECAARLQMIHQIAQAIAVEISSNECQVVGWDRLRETGT